MSPSALPRPLGRYTLLRRLAVGGMAEVFLAKAQNDSGFEKRVAIKSLHARAEGSDEAPSLAAEAKLAVRLAHPNIVQTFDLGHEDGTDFIVMEYVEGLDAQSLVDVLRGEGRLLPPALAAFIIAEVCRGLDHAHRCEGDDGRPVGVIHRDVSPQNVLLSAAGEVKLADFGIAKTKARASDPDARVIKGKYFYMSPEQASADSLDRRSDIYSAGVVLWELLTGERLHDAPDVRTLLERVRRADVPLPSVRRPNVPAFLDAIVARATARRPAERYPDAASMARELETYLGAEAALRWRPELASLVSAIRAGASKACRPGTSNPVPRTRDGASTRSAPGRVTPGPARLRYGLADGRPTLAGLRSPVRADVAWFWWAAFGTCAVALLAIAWFLHGA